ncbi:hypothetical protein R6Q59_006875 [Mikania micrantha]
MEFKVLTEFEKKKVSANEKRNIQNGPNHSGRVEWRPPWRYVEAAPYVVVRFEWRPPWQTHSVLEDKNVLKRWGMIRATHFFGCSSHNSTLQIVGSFTCIRIDFFSILHA